MSKLNSFVIFLLFHLQAVLAFSSSFELDQTWAHHQQCIDMSGTQTFVPDKESSILVTFEQGYEGIVSIVIFELRDEHLGGMYRPGSNEKEVFCTQENIRRGLCNQYQIGEFLISDEARINAHQPFITRAVNLTMPVALLYPVTSAGYYCAAAIHVTPGGRFSATMAAVEHGNSIPAFRAGLLAVYRYITPFWVGFMLTWTAWRWEFPQQGFCCRTGLMWIIPLSIVQVTVRWIALNVGRDNLKLSWTLFWYTLSAVGDTGIILNIYEYTLWTTSSHWKRKLGSWLTYVLAFASISLHAASSWTDYIADACSKGSVYTNIVFGFSLLIYTGTCAVCLLRGQPRQDSMGDERRGTFMIEDDTALLYTRPAMGAVVACIGILFGVLAVLNLWAVVNPRPPLEFATTFWQKRYFLFDGAIEFTFLLWTATLALRSVQCASTTPNDYPIDRSYDLSRA